MKQLIVLSLTCFFMTACVKSSPSAVMHSILRVPIPKESKSQAYVELSRNDQFVGLYSSVGKVVCDEPIAKKYLNDCGFKATANTHFPLDLNMDKVPWWPSNVYGAVRFQRDDGDRGYISSVWLDGALYFYFDRK